MTPTLVRDIEVKQLPKGGFPRVKQQILEAESGPQRKVVTGGLTWIDRASHAVHSMNGYHSCGNSIECTALRALPLAFNPSATGKPPQALTTRLLRVAPSSRPSMGIVISWTTHEEPSGGSSSTTVIQTPGSYTFTTPEKLAKKLLDKIYDDIDTSSISKTHLALAITFAIYSVLPLIPVFFELSKRVKRWYSQRLMEDVQLDHAQIPQSNKDDVSKRASGALPLAFFLTLLFWLVYYVTEAVTAHGKGVIITTFENYRFTTAQRYASLVMSDLAVLVMLLYVVNLRLTRVPKILFWLSFILTITVYACMLSISPSNPRSPSIAEAARILRHTESGIYLVLVVLVTRATWKLHRAIASARFTGFPRDLKYAYARFLPLLWIRTLEYLTFYILVYIPVTLNIRYDILYVVNLAVCAFCHFMIMHCITAAYPRVKDHGILPRARAQPQARQQERWDVASLVPAGDAYWKRLGAGRTLGPSPKREQRRWRYFIGGLGKRLLSFATYDQLGFEPGAPSIPGTAHRLGVVGVGPFATKLSADDARQLMKEWLSEGAFPTRSLSYPDRDLRHQSGIFSTNHKSREMLYAPENPRFKYTSMG
ncbi:hypothetical protein FB451DRAFT_1495597 [Mycena latifolia]|nr:hypothetical protein FB451DRAFT_1495597 [Mycena latifolia]